MKTIIGLAVFLLFTAHISAQTIKSNEEENLLKKGSWAVQFQVGGNFTLGSFENVIVSLKTHFSPKLALRFGAGFNANNIEQTLDYKEYYYGYSGSGIPTTNNSINITVLTKLLYYFNPKSKLNVYAGLGPLGIYSHSTNERFYLDGYKEYREINTWATGLNGVFGCEVFAFRFLSLFAEYSVTATYGKTTDKDSVKDFMTNEIVEYYDTKSTTFNFSGNVVRLGLSLYF